MLRGAQKLWVQITIWRKSTQRLQQKPKARKKNLELDKVLGAGKTSREEKRARVICLEGKAGKGAPCI